MSSVGAGIGIEQSPPVNAETCLYDTSRLFFTVAAVVESFKAARAKPKTFDTKVSLASNLMDASAMLK